MVLADFVVKESSSYNQTTTTLYFIGYPLLENSGLSSVVLFVRGRAYNTPPVGGKLVVDQLTAKTILETQFIRDERHGNLPLFTQDEELAQTVAKIYEANPKTPFYQAINPSKLLKDMIGNPLAVVKTIVSTATKEDIPVLQEILSVVSARLDELTSVEAKKSKDKKE